MKYRESMDLTKEYKSNYIKGIEQIIKERQKQAEIVRKESMKDIFENQEKYRNEFKKMLGWPLSEHKSDGLPGVVSEKLSEEDGYSIYRMQFEILKGLTMTGLFFKEGGEEPKPLVIVQHGGEGTPELISGVYGNTYNYNDMLQRVRKNGVHVFAPQLLLWNENYNVDFDRKAIDAELKRVGSSITAVEIYGITRILDYFEAQKYVSVFGMVGLSYGGFYTLYTAAVDTRIKAAISCSFFNKRDIITWSDWTWYKSAEKFDDAEVACLVYPRKLYIEMGNQDELFDYVYSEESFERLKEICCDFGMEWAELIVFNGVHEFCKDDEPIRHIIKILKNLGI